MITITENDIKDLKDLINSKFESLDNKFESLDNKFESLEKKITHLEFKTELSLTEIKTTLKDWKPSVDKISDLTEKVGELKNWKQIGLLLATAIITSIFWILRDLQI